MKFHSRVFCAAFCDFGFAGNKQPLDRAADAPIEPLRLGLHEPCQPEISLV
jgi:hypothetical protein